ncbi:hypothetical protein [uncultured Microbacterium sp.]|uniref:hypothetical protein n=1 Tax=uncultured Microbacterium sp. TaxID=191216 RepID=UPI0035C9719C
MPPTPPAQVSMNRHEMALPDRMIRAFSGRGAVSLSDHSVTGLQFLQFTPYEQPDWHFNLQFVHDETGCTILDSVDRIWEYHERTGEGSHPLGLNFTDAVGTASYDPVVFEPIRALVLQSATWQTNQLTRTGTFHKRISGRLISFSIRSQARVSDTLDEAYLEVTIRNRAVEELALTVQAHQSIADPQRVNPAENDVAAHVSHRAITGPVWQWPGGRQEQHVSFSSAAVSDLPETETGWSLVVPPGEERTFTVGIVFAPGDAVAPASTDPSVAARARAAGIATIDRLAAATSALPTVTSPVEGLEELYNRCITTVLEARWDRPDWQLSPFYCAGSWLFTLAWDLSFSSAAVALMDPTGLRQEVVRFLTAGLMKHSYIGWNGTLGHHYAYTVFAGVRLLRDYLRVTGDRAFLDRALDDGRSVFETIRDDLTSVVEQRIGDDGLVDFGSNSNDYLETRTDGYQSRIALSSLMLVDALTWLAALCGARGDDASRHVDSARRVRAAVDEHLWRADEGWYANRLADGSTELMWSYHLFDALDTDAISPDQRAALVSHLVDGVFLGPHGMYSIAKTDEVHWDLDDADWGGGGQYTGMPLRVAESLWRQGEPDAAWQILNRCITWTRAFPYIPQEIYTDSLRTANIEQPVEVAAGAGIQAVIFGLFGIRPDASGGLTVALSQHPSSVGSALRGYRHGSRLVDVFLHQSEYRVVVDGVETSVPYGTNLTI